MGGPSSEVARTSFSKSVIDAGGGALTSFANFTFLCTTRGRLNIRGGNSSTPSLLPREAVEGFRRMLRGPKCAVLLPMPNGSEHMDSLDEDREFSDKNEPGETGEHELEADAGVPASPRRADERAESMPGQSDNKAFPARGNGGGLSFKLPLLGRERPEAPSIDTSGPPPQLGDLSACRCSASGGCCCSCGGNGRRGAGLCGPAGGCSAGGRRLNVRRAMMECGLPGVADPTGDGGASASANEAGAPRFGVYVWPTSAKSRCCSELLALDCVRLFKISAMQTFRSVMRDALPQGSATLRINISEKTVRSSK